ncbi:MAG: sugar phosphate nucleotidyltransferase [Egibacteraceae bacterium]
MPGCVILAAGKGTRLGPLGTRIAKAMLPVGGQPFLELLVARCLAAGLRPVVVTISHHAEDIRAHFADVRWGDAGLILHKTHQKGTGGDLLDATARLPAGRFVVCNGDTVLDIDIRAVLTFHDEAPDRGVIVLTRRRGVPNENAIVVDDDNVVTASFEAAAVDKIWSGAMQLAGSATGTLVLPHGLLEEINRDGPSSLEQDVLPVLIERRMLRAFDNSLRYFLDFGTPDRLAQLRREHEAILRVLACEKGECV